MSINTRQISWKVDAYKTKHNRFWWKVTLKKLNAKQVRGPHGPYWVIEASDNEVRRITRKLRFAGFKYNWYKKEWSRASNCRDRFFRLTKAPYRCRYCNRHLKKEYVEVDHLIPVGKVKNNRSHARQLMNISKLDDINDIRNLVASCRYCNRRKGDKLGIWYIRGILGKYKIYWTIVYILKLCILILLLYIIMKTDLGKEIHYWLR